MVRPSSVTSVLINVLKLSVDKIMWDLEKKSKNIKFKDSLANLQR